MYNLLAADWNWEILGTAPSTHMRCETGFDLFSTIITDIAKVKNMSSKVLYSVIGGKGKESSGSSNCRRSHEGGMNFSMIVMRQEG